jgi:hypothetical protein
VSVFVAARRRLAFVVVLAALLSCATGCGEDDCHGELYISNGFPAAERELAYRAADRWNAMAGTTIVHLTDGDQETCTMRRIETEADRADMRDDYDDPTHLPSGLTNRVTHDARIDPTVAPTHLGATIMHEMGHMLGLHHVDAERAMMAPYRERQSDEPTEADLQECRDEGICP